MRHTRAEALCTPPPGQVLSLKHADLVAYLQMTAIALIGGAARKPVPKPAVVLPAAEGGVDFAARRGHVVRLLVKGVTFVLSRSFRESAAAADTAVAIDADDDALAGVILQNGQDAIIRPTVAVVADSNEVIATLQVSPISS